MTGCDACTGDGICTTGKCQTDNGYYEITGSGGDATYCQVCSNKCSTCQGDSNSCITCGSGLVSRSFVPPRTEPKYGTSTVPTTMVEIVECVFDIVRPFSHQLHTNPNLVLM